MVKSYAATHTGAIEEVMGFESHRLHFILLEKRLIFCSKRLFPLFFWFA